MKGKAVKLIIGIVLLVVAVVLFLIKVNSWLCLAIAVIGLVLVVLSFKNKKQLPAVSAENTSSEAVSEYMPEEHSESTEVKENE